jgi:trans-aconitate methyltransferase
MVAERKDVWASGEAYEPYVGRWSRLVAREFVGWLDLPPNRRWLDVGCGTGALSDVILQCASPSQVSGIDPSPGFVSFACHKVSPIGDRPSRSVMPKHCLSLTAPSMQLWQVSS